MSARLPGTRGFTLVELLIALFVAALMFAIGYGAITQSLESRDRVRIQQQRLGDLQRGMRTFVQDFVQVAPRPVRDALGTADEPALLADPRTTSLVSFTRGGVSNFAGLQRPELQRIEYLLDGTDLVRLVWPVLDRTQAVTPRRRVLLRGVTAVRLRYMDASRQWLDQWPSPLVSGPPARRLRQRPIAVELTLEVTDIGSVRRVIEVAG